MNRTSCLVAASAVLLCLGSPARAAMRERSLEFGAYVTGAHFDNESNVENDAGPGGRVGIVFVPRHELEFSLDFIRTRDDLGLDLDVDLTTFKTGYVYNPLPRAAVSPLLTVGAGAQHLRVSEDFGFGSNEVTDETDPLAFAGVGVRFFIGQVLNIRVDGQVVAVFPDGDSEDRLVDRVLNVGVGWVVGGH